MNYSIDLYQGAQQELHDAYNWYEQRSQGYVYFERCSREF